MYRHSLLLGEGGYYRACKRAYVATLALAAIIRCEGYPRVERYALSPLQLSLAVYRCVVRHATDVGSRVGLLQYCVAGPPHPLIDILRHILALAAIIQDA